MKERRVPHLHVEVFKGHSVPPQQLHGVPGHEAQSEEALHLVGAGPPGHLTTRREEGRRYDHVICGRATLSALFFCSESVKRLVRDSRCEAYESNSCVFEGVCLSTLQWVTIQLIGGLKVCNIWLD